MYVLPLLLGAALAAAPAPAERRPFTVDDLLAIERVSAPTISPDGKQVAFVVSKAAKDGKRLHSALWLAPVAAPQKARPLPPARQLTFATERITSPRFAPDGRRIAFVSSREGTPQAYVLDLAGGEARKVTAFPAGADELLWTPQGDALLVLADVDPACGADMACNAKAEADAEGKPKLTDRLLYRHWNVWRERARTHLLRVPLDGGAVVDLTPGDRDVPPFFRGGAGDLAVSADGKTVYFIAISDPVEAISTNADVYAVPATGGEAKRLTTGKGWDGKPRPSPDGKRLAWLSQERAGYESDKFRILVGNADGSGARDLTASVDLSADDLYWANGGRTIRFGALEAGRHHLYEVDVATAKVRRLTKDVNLGALEPSRDGGALVALVDSIAAPPEVAAITVDGGAASVRALTSFGAKVMDRVALGALRPLEAKAQDGTTVHGWIVTPPGHRAGEKRPTLVLVHGGPQGAWNDAWSFRWNPQIYAAQGWTVVMPNPRGSTGFGQAYTDAVSGDWGGKPYTDVMTLVDAAIATGAADGGNMCAAGASYGGYMIHWINGKTDRFRCLVAHAGNFDSAFAYYDTEELWFPEWENGGPPWERPDAYAKFSPSRFVQDWKTPTLVTHGELDFRVNVAQGMGAFTALQRRGIPSKLLVFPDEGHWILKPKNSKVFHDVVVAWLAEHLDRESGRAANAR